MNETHKVKRIVIIGGMGPQASIHAHRRLQELLTSSFKEAEIVHVSLAIEHFFNTKPKLNLTNSQVSLLNSIEADVGFIACNTAHLFIDDISKIVNFKLFSMINFKIEPKTLMVCSPSSKKFEVFGESVEYLNDELDRISGNVISAVNEGELTGATKDFKKLISLLPNDKTPVLSCTELSMLGSVLGLKLRCTLEESLKKIVKDV